MHLFGHQPRFHHLRIAFAIFCGLAVIFSTMPVFQGPDHHHHHEPHHHHGHELTLAFGEAGLDGENGITQEHGHIGAHEHHQVFLMIREPSYNLYSAIRFWLAFTHEVPPYNFQDRLERPPRNIAQA